MTLSILTGGESIAKYQLVDSKHVKKNGINGADTHEARELGRMEIKTMVNTFQNTHRSTLNRPSCLLTLNLLNSVDAQVIFVD